MIRPSASRIPSRAVLRWSVWFVAFMDLCVPILLQTRNRVARSLALKQFRRRHLSLKTRVLWQVSRNQSGFDIPHSVCAFTVFAKRDALARVSMAWHVHAVRAFGHGPPRRVFDVPLLKKMQILRWQPLAGNCLASGRFRGSDQSARRALRLVEGFFEGRLRADSRSFADALGFLLLHRLPRRKN